MSRFLSLFQLATSILRQLPEPAFRRTLAGRRVWSAVFLSASTDPCRSVTFTRNIDAVLFRDDREVHDVHSRRMLQPVGSLAFNATVQCLMTVNSVLVDEPGLPLAVPPRRCGARIPRGTTAPWRWGLQGADDAVRKNAVSQCVVRKTGTDPPETLLAQTGRG